MTKPTFKYERALTEKGYFVIGVDEVGCGCLAGPVIAAAIHLPLNSRISEINDSKLLRHEKRKDILVKFIEIGMKWTIGMATAQEVDKMNVRRATLLAMKRAIEAFQGATFALIDAWTIPGLKIMQKGIVHGDRFVKSIAAASIVAKVVRDKLMCEFDKDFPQYDFARHKGYGTRIHKAALKRLGCSSIHRKTFLKKT